MSEPSEHKTPQKQQPIENVESVKVDIMNKLQWMRRHLQQKVPLEKMNETMDLIRADAEKLKDSQVTKHLDTLHYYINQHWPIDPNLPERECFDIKKVIEADIDNIMHRMLQI